MTAVIEKLHELEQSEKAKAREDFAKLIVRLGSGEDVEFSEVQAITQANNKSARELESAVNSYGYWLKRTNRIAEIDAASDEFPELNKKIEAANAELAAAQAIRDQTVYPLAQRIAEVQQWQLEKMSIEREMRDRSNPELCLRLRELQREGNRIDNAMFGPRSELETAEEALSSAKRRGDKAEIEAAERMAKRARERFASFEAQRAECTRQMNVVHAKMIDAEAFIK